MQDLDKKRELAKKIMQYATEAAEQEGLDVFDVQESLSLALVAGFSVLNFSAKDFTQYLRDMREGYIKLQNKLSMYPKNDK